MHIIRPQIKWMHHRTLILKTPALSQRRTIPAPRRNRPLACTLRQQQQILPQLNWTAIVHLLLQLALFTSEKAHRTLAMLHYPHRTYWRHPLPVASLPMEKKLHWPPTALGSLKQRHRFRQVMPFFFFTENCIYSRMFLLSDTTSTSAQSVRMSLGKLAASAPSGAAHPSDSQGCQASSFSYHHLSFIATHYKHKTVAIFIRNRHRFVGMCSPPPPPHPMKPNRFIALAFDGVAANFEDSAERKKNKLMALSGWFGDGIQEVAISLCYYEKYYICLK